MTDRAINGTAINGDLPVHHLRIVNQRWTAAATEHDGQNATYPDDGHHEEDVPARVIPRRTLVGPPVGDPIRRRLRTRHRAAAMFTML